MRGPLTRAEVAAMWLWGAEYARQNRGVREWYAGISQSRKDVVADFLAGLDSASDSSAIPSAPERGAETVLWEVIDAARDVSAAVGTGGMPGEMPDAEYLAQLRLRHALIALDGETEPTHTEG